MTQLAKPAIGKKPLDRRCPPAHEVPANGVSGRRIAIEKPFPRVAAGLNPKEVARHTSRRA